MNSPSSLKLVSWNMAHRENTWQHLLNLNADIALLQEACEPPPDIIRQIDTDSSPWKISENGINRPWRSAVVNITKRFPLKWLPQKRLGDAFKDEIEVSRPGTLQFAEVELPSGNRLVVNSMYALWERPHQSTGSSWIYADACVHRLISDISAMIGQESNHRIIAAGDLNILHGYGEYGNKYWSARYASIF